LVRTYGINAFTPATIIDEAVLDREFLLIREQGYAIDREESAADGWCFAAPIWTSADRVAAAVSASFLKSRVRDEDNVIRAVRQAGEAISARLKTP
jgi:DNA-binding IclR family transcriptional regulator